MSPSRRLRRTAALGVISAFALGASAPSASAERFDLTTGTTVSSGRAHGYGSVAFPTPRTVKVAARIDDLCAAGRTGDGYGAYLEVRVTLDAGVVFQAFQDTAGCTGAGRPISFTWPFAQQEVRSVRILVFEGKDVGGGQVRIGDTARKVVTP